MKKQVLVIHGGDAFATYEEYLTSLRDYKVDLSYFRRKGWKKTLPEKLGENYDVLNPEMPDPWNAKYIEWQIVFEKILPLLNDAIILIGHSLGGSFLAKYLSENKINKKIVGVFLVAACYDKDANGNGLHTFAMPEKLSMPTDKVFLYHSKDDTSVPFGDLELFHKQLPQATLRIFEDRNHFHQEEIPELVEDIKNLV